MRLPFYMSTVFIPLIGLCVDKYGKRAYLLVISGVLGTITYILFITVTPILPLIGLGKIFFKLGLTYSIFCGVYWPSIVLILPPKLIPIAYGLGTSILNLGLALTPIAITYIYNSSFSYEVTMVFFIVLLSLSLIIAIIILIEDIKSHSNLLNSVVKEKEPTVLACEDQEGLLKVKN